MTVDLQLVLVTEKMTDPAKDTVEPLFENIAAHSTDSIMLLDHKGVIRFINRTVPSLTPQEVMGTTVYDHVPWEQHEEMRRCFARVLETGEADRFENLYYSADGDLTRWESRVGPIKEGDIITGFVVFASDVTERRRAAEERDRIFELSKDLHCVSDHAGYFMRVNPAFHATLGYLDEEVRRRPFIEFVHPEDREATRATYEVAKTRTVTAFENRFVCADGSVRRFQWRTTPDELASRVIGIGRDVTEERELERQLRQSQKMDAVGQLAGGVAHDFNNLLQAILGNIALARSEILSSAALGFLDDIEAAATRATQLTRRLVAFSDSRPLEMAPLDLNPLIADLLKLLRPVISANITIEYEAIDIARVEADRSQVEQVLMNLCLNARDAIRKRGRITIRTRVVNARERAAPLMDSIDSISSAPPTPHVLISVQDTGVGMVPEIQERIFEPFFTTKASGEGTGLGLAVVYGIDRNRPFGLTSGAALATVVGVLSSQGNVKLIAASRSAAAVHPPACPQCAKCRRHFWR